MTKYHARIEAVGTLDESTAALGLARAQCLDPHSAPILLEAQRDLYKLMAEVAATPENAEKFRFIDAARVTWLEEQTDAISTGGDAEGIHPARRFAGRRGAFAGAGDHPPGRTPRGGTVRRAGDLATPICSDI